jgi:hypothetical protein
MRLSHFAVLVAILCLFPCEASAATQMMRAPFGFTWGQSQKDVEKNLLGAKARIVEHKSVQGRTVVAVEGIPQRMLMRTLFYFDSDALTEIELQYGNASWDSVKYAELFDTTRQNIDTKYGSGRLLAREKSRDGDFLYTLIGYKWTQGYMSLCLFLYTADKGSESVRVVSLHYKQM